MGRLRGARGKPHELKVLQGEKRPDRLNPDEPKPEMKHMDPPEHLSDDAKEYWRFYFDVLMRMRVMTEADGKQLEIFCNACADEKKYRKMIEEEGAIVRTFKIYEGVVTCVGSKLHPATRLLKIASDAIDKYGGALALTPQDRSRLQIKSPEAEKPQGIKAFIKQ